MEVEASERADGGSTDPAPVPDHRGSRHHRRARWILVLVAGVVVAAAVAGGTLWATRQPEKPATRHATSLFPPPGMHLYFFDAFSGSKLDTANWDTCYPPPNPSGCTNYSNAELQWYLPGQDRVTGGALGLVAEQKPTLARDRTGAPATYQWRSGIVTTYRSFRFTYGYLEVSARFPQADGMWPALWLLSADSRRPGEIDIAEQQYPQKLQVVLHSTTGLSHYLFLDDSTAGWHTYAVDWEPSSVTWYIDRRQVYRYTGPDVPSTPMYLLADLAVANYPYSSPNAATPSKASLDVSYVAIYQTNR